MIYLLIITQKLYQGKGSKKLENEEKTKKSKGTFPLL
jgi:hypothetical protein